MDSKTFRLSILAVITTMVLIAVVVYAANRDKINSMIGSGKAPETEVAVSDGDTMETAYGEQIGDNLKGFLTASDFFDKSEQRPSVVVVVDNVPVPANADEPVEKNRPTEGGISSGNAELVPDEHGMLHEAPGVLEGNAN
jgi:hypothetical protein